MKVVKGCMSLWYDHDWKMKFQVNRLVYREQSGQVNMTPNFIANGPKDPRFNPRQKPSSDVSVIYIIKEGLSVCLSVCLCVCMYPSSAHSFWSDRHETWHGHSLGPWEWHGVSSEREAQGSEATEKREREAQSLMDRSDWECEREARSPRERSDRRGSGCASPLAALRAKRVKGVHFFLHFYAF